MADKSQNVYGSMGSVPDVAASGTANAGSGPQANANDFGGQIGEAESNAGQSAENIGNQFMQMSTEAKAKDDYANKYVPAAIDLRQKFDSLRGQDKVGGYDDYVKGLQDLNKQFITQQPGIYGQQVMSGLVKTHVEGEMMGARRELVDSQKQFADQSTWDTIKANQDLAGQNYNNQPLVDSIQNQNDNHVLIAHIDAGHDPADSASGDLIKSAQDKATAGMAKSMVSSALNSGDPKAANTFRSRYASVLPGYEKLGMDNMLHVANMNYTGIDAVHALTTGRSMPPAVGAPAVQVQSLVANTAKTTGVDPNNALAVLRIESSNGQNLGSRGTLGQDKESAGKPLEDQAQALATNLKAANNKATEALGRPCEPWEGYAVYQQGVGGGPALLKADPNSKAIDVLTPLYKNRDDALSALLSNGGNVTMSAKDFCDHIKQTYNDNAKRASGDLNVDNPGDAIKAPHEMTGTAVQPANSPMQSQLNFESKVPNMMAQINAIPNYEQRAGVMKAFNQERQRYNDAAIAYKNVLTAKAGQLAADPKFTDIKQIPPEMQSALAQDHPQTLDYMEKAATRNLERQSGNTTKDQKEYGGGMHDVMNDIWNGNITNIAQLHDQVSNGKLTIAGYDRAVKEIQGKNTPESAGDDMMKKQFFAMAKSQISGTNEELHMKDPKGEELYLKWMAQALPAIEEGKNQGKNVVNMLNPESPDYIGDSIKHFVRPPSQWIADMQEDSGTKPDEEDVPKAPFFQRLMGKTAPKDVNTTAGFTNWTKTGEVTPDILKSEAERLKLTDSSTLMGLRYQLQTGKITREQAEAEAVKRGFAKPRGPQVPIAE